MNEEKPVFKVTDRRLFNADGSPRDVVREERPAETITTPLAASPTLSTTKTEAPSTSVMNSTPESANIKSSVAPTAGAATAGEVTTGDAIATNPFFIELMMFAAENAAAMLSGHPQFGGEVNLPYAKQFIDMLGALQEKTLGNLSLEEQSTLDALLGQLRMQYVSASKARPAAPTNITGGDITGGR
jgi:hypothetical protein